MDGLVWMGMGLAVCYADFADSPIRRFVDSVVVRIGPKVTRCEGIGWVLDGYWMGIGWPKTAKKIRKIIGDITVNV